MGPKMPASHKAYGMEYLPPPRPLTKLYQVAQPPAVSWRRHVIRFPPGVEVSMARDVMTLSGKTGTLEVDLKRADPQGALAFQLHELSGGSGSGGSGASAGGAGGAAQQAAQPSQQPKSYLLFLASPMQKGGFFHPAVRRIENAISGVTQGFLVGLTLKGVGYRMEPVDALRVRHGAAQPAALRVILQPRLTALFYPVLGCLPLCIRLCSLPAAAARLRASAWV